MDIKSNALHGSSNVDHAKANIKLVFGDVEFTPDGELKGTVSGAHPTAYIMFNISVFYLLNHYGLSQKPVSFIICLFSERLKTVYQSVILLKLR